MASSSAPWKQLLLSSIQANSHLKHYSYLQLATVSSNNRPSNRTVVFRGFQDDGDKILINTDTRSRKQSESPSLDPSTGPVGAFCLLVLDPDQVDYLNLKSNERLTFTSEGSVNGQKLWTSEKVNA